MTGPVLIPWEEIPAAVFHYLWANAPHVLDGPAVYTMRADGSLLVTPQERKEAAE